MGSKQHLRTKYGNKHFHVWLKMKPCFGPLAYLHLLASAPPLFLPAVFPRRSREVNVIDSLFKLLLVPQMSHQLCVFVMLCFVVSCSLSYLRLRPRPHSGGAAEEGGERREGVLVLRPQRGEEIGHSRARREAEVRRHTPAGHGTPGEVGRENVEKRKKEVKVFHKDKWETSRSMEKLMVKKI